MFKNVLLIHPAIAEKKKGTTEIISSR